MSQAENSEREVSFTCDLGLPRIDRFYVVAHHAISIGHSTAMITTVDPGRSTVDHRLMKAYSEDLRRKVVHALEQRGISKSEAARLFGISLSSVKRYARLVDRGEPLTPRKGGGRPP
jgi:hypothetical protein